VATNHINILYLTSILHLRKIISIIVLNCHDRIFMIELVIFVAFGIAVVSFSLLEVSKIFAVLIILVASVISLLSKYFPEFLTYSQFFV